MPWSAVWGKEVRKFTTEAGWGRPAAPAGVAAAGREGAPSRVLVIDDEPQIRRFLEISLRSEGFVVTEAVGVAPASRLA